MIHITVTCNGCGSTLDREYKRSADVFDFLLTINREHLCFNCRREQREKEDDAIKLPRRKSKEVTEAIHA